MTEVTDDPSLAADLRSVRFRASVGEPVDVRISGHRVWTVRPGVHNEAGDGFVELLWPKALAERLRGSAVVEAREAPGGPVLGRANVVFDDQDEQPDLLDVDGRPLSLTKYGRLRTAFEALSVETRDAYLDQAEAVIRALRVDCGREAFLDYGTLLGAVRDGALIGHDLDIDIGYLSAADNPADAIRESYVVERTLRARHGWRIVRKDGALLQVFFPQVDGRRRNIDIFSAFVMDGHIYQVHDTEAPGSAADLVPTRDVLLEGRHMPAPHRPEVLLEALYGPSWRVPDPSFSYDSTSAQRKLAAWFVGPRRERDQWAQFYARRGATHTMEPTDFARWVEARSDATRLIDVGCGNGRDTLHFSRQGREARGLDAVPGVLLRARQAAKDEGLQATFRRLNLNSVRETLAEGALAARYKATTAVYGRFLLHALAPASQENFWRYCAMTLSGGGQCFVEFRVERDGPLPKHFAERQHAYLHPRVAVTAARRAGGTVVHREVGQGLARFQNEDPYVCRLVVEW